VAYENFHIGYKKMDLAPDELIVSVRVPRRDPFTRASYRKVGTRRAQAISKICFAAGIRSGADGVLRDVRIALGSVAPTVVRARAAEDVLRGGRPDAQRIAAARRALATDITPIDDIRSTASYRLKVAGNLLEEFLA
jgi:CO/xanthine dehydrogenase FAD-binding subunit